MWQTIRLTQHYVTRAEIGEGATAKSFIVAAARYSHYSSMTDLATHVATTGQLLVRSGIEIDRILSAMVQDHAAVSASLPSQVIFLSRLVRADPVKQRVMLAYSGYDAADTALLKSAAVNFKCHHRWAQLGFACTRPRPATYLGERVIKMDAPTIVVALKHNKSVVHQRVPREAPDLRCQLPIGATALEARLVDMSLDGHAFILADSAIPICAGTWVRGTRITPQGAQPVVVDIEIKYVIPTVLSDGDRVTRIGCRIVGDDDALKQLVSTFVIEVR